MKKTSILITGANGFVGRVLSNKLSRQDYEVRAAVRSINNCLANVEQVKIGSIGSATDWTAALRNVQAVVHLAARVHVMKDSAANPLDEFREVNVAGTKRLAQEAAKAGVKRFVYISSIKVNGEQTLQGKPFTEDVTTIPKDNYGLSKYEAEKELLHISKDTGMEVVIIRPPLVYGEGVKANFASMLRAVRNRTPLPFGSIKNLRSFIYVGNLISFIIKCIEHPKAANQTFLVSDNCDLSTTELLQGCAEALEVNARLLPVPSKLIEIVAIILGKQDLAKRLLSNLQLDISKARKLLDWSPPISVSDGLKATVLDLKVSKK